MRFQEQLPLPGHQQQPPHATWQRLSLPGELAGIGAGIGRVLLQDPLQSPLQIDQSAAAARLRPEGSSMRIAPVGPKGPGHLSPPSSAFASSNDSKAKSSWCHISCPHPRRSRAQAVAALPGSESSHSKASAPGPDFHLQSKTAWTHISNRELLPRVNIRAHFKY